MTVIAAKANEGHWRLKCSNWIREFTDLNRDFGVRIHWAIRIAKKRESTERFGSRSWKSENSLSDSDIRGTIFATRMRLWILGNYRSGRSIWGRHYYFLFALSLNGEAVWLEDAWKNSQIPWEILQNSLGLWIVEPVKLQANEFRALFSHKMRLEIAGHTWGSERWAELLNRGAEWNCWIEMLDRNVGSKCRVDVLARNAGSSC